MTQATTTIPIVLTEDHDTRAGNYFVSNYPPYSFWKPEYAEEAVTAIDRAPNPETPLGVYLHIPFCRRRCHFCYFRVYTDKNAADIMRYIESAIAEIKLYGQKAFIGGRKPKFVYFGGGTPSYLSTTQLRYLTDNMKAVLPWDEAEEVTFECEPGTLTEAKVKTIRDIGVTRLSLGVEHFDERTLKLNGRAHGASEIDRAYGFIQANDFPQVNIDLIAGMMGDTDEGWEFAIKRTLELAPDSVTIYQMEIPYNTTIYRDMQTQGHEVAPVAGWIQKREWVTYAFEQLEANGYSISSAYTAVKNSSKTSFVYRDQLWTGADLIGLGVASFSHIGGTHFQNQHNLDPYLEKLEKGELPIYRALTPTSEETLIRELILQSKLGYIRKSYFQNKFGVDLLTRFASAFATLFETGYLHDEGDVLRFTRQGLLQVDRLVHEFFLPQHRDARYA